MSNMSDTLKRFLAIAALVLVVAASMGYFG